MPTTHDALHALFHPRAVAVIGASDDTVKHGYIVLTNIRDTGFKGGIYGISHRLKDVDGIPCFPDFAAIPEQVDTAFLAIPAKAAVQAVRDCARAGLKAVIVGSAGYAESLDAGGLERQQELRLIAHEEGIRIVGPNCNGIYNAHHPISVGFNTAHAKKQTPGGVSIFSHSGALFDAMAGRLAMAGAGLSLFASAGNEADMSVLDYLEYAITHAPTKVIALLIDSLADGARFRALAIRAHAAGKPVVALKIGGSEAGAAAAIAHSSRLAGDAASYRALLDVSGVAVADTLEGLMTAAALLSKYGPRPGKLGALSTSGAGASLIADRCEVLGVPLAPLTEATRAGIDKHKLFSRVGNPLDLGIFGGMRKSGEVPLLLMNDPEVSVVLALLHSMNPWQGDPYRAAMAAAKAASGRPVLIVSPGGLPAAERATNEAMGMAVFTKMDIVLEGIRALMTRPPAPVPAIAGQPRADLTQARLRDLEDLRSLTRKLSEAESLAVLDCFGIDAVQAIHCPDGPAAAAAAGSPGMGFPVVVKKIVEGIAHKSDFGLVRLGLTNGDAVIAAVDDMGGGPVLLQPMIAGDLEAIAGVTRAPGVGVVLLAGLGGIHAETLGAVAMWPIPVDRATIETGLRTSALGRVLNGSRWKHPNAVAGFLDALMALQSASIWFGGRLRAIDVNPIVLGANGATAVDALVIPRP